MNQGQESQASALGDFLRERVSKDLQVMKAVSADALRSFFGNASVSVPPEIADQICNRLEAEEVASSKDIIGFKLPNGRSLICSPLSGGNELVYVVSLIGATPQIASALIRSAFETWNLQGELGLAQAALDESAMQLAQSFEEQNWLRGFAKNTSSLTGLSNPNEIARGILEPLGYLLRAQDVFLIVDSVESEKSGMVSAKFGDSPFSIRSIRAYLDTYGFQVGAPPLVRNNLPVDGPKDEAITSVIAVAVSNGEDPFGIIVAINRSADLHLNGLPVYDPEFGSGDVGLLEEAAVLLTTQAQNLHLLLQSNQLFLGTLHAMSSTIDARDPYTQGHSERVARLSFDLANILGLGEAACQEIYLAGILHDIGKIGIPDDVLLKPGKLTDEEFAVIQQHPEIGYRIVERLGHLQFALPGVLHHHERWDGKGYPHGLSGLEIPLMARVMAVADAFDAMTSSRPYRQAMPISKAHNIIRDGAAAQWDAEVVGCLNQWLRDNKSLSSSNDLGQSVIPQDAPTDYLNRAVMALVH